MDNNECEPAWRVVLTCCGRSDGFLMARTWEDADRIRENYTSGPGVHPNGYSAPEREPGHKRSAIVESAALAASPRPLTEPDDIWEVSGDYAQGYRKGWQDAQKPANLNTKPPAGSPRSLTEPALPAMATGPYDEWIGRLFDGFSDLMKSAEARGDIYGVGFAKSMRDSFAALLRAIAAPHPLVSPSEPPWPLSSAREKVLAGLLRETWELADNWPGIAYTEDLEDRIEQALGAPRTFGRASLSPAPSITGGDAP